MSEVSEDGSGSPLKTRSSSHLDNIQEVRIRICFKLGSVEQEGEQEGEEEGMEKEGGDKRR